jgi:hypothetical protein
LIPWDLEVAQQAMSDKGFGEFLVTERILHAEGLRQALDTQRSMEGRLDTVLLDLGLVSELTLLAALGRYHSTRTVSRTDLAHAIPEVARLVSPRVATRLLVVPFRHEGKTISIATVSPGDLLIEDEIGLLTGCLVSTFVTLEVRLVEAMARLYGVVPSIQIASVLKRINEEPGQRADAGPAAASSKPPRNEPAAVVHQDGTTTPWAVAMRPSRSADDSLVLEISQEELNEFPSLRGGIEPPPERGPERIAEAPVDRPEGPDERLVAASVALQNAEMREDIGDALLEYCSPYLSRRLLLVVRRGKVIGWRGDGADIERNAVRKLVIPLDQPSVFTRLSDRSSYWLGALPRLPANQPLIRALGGIPPSETVILPIFVGSKPLGFLYGDNRDRGVAEVPLTHLRRLVAKADLAFQAYLLKGKIRTL